MGVFSDCSFVRLLSCGQSKAPHRALSRAGRDWKGLCSLQEVGGVCSHLCRKLCCNAVVSMLSPGQRREVMPTPHLGSTEPDTLIHESDRL